MSESGLVGKHLGNQHNEWWRGNGNATPYVLRAW